MPNSKTTAGALATELAEFKSALAESSAKLSGEIKNIRNSRKEIEEEYVAVANGFVKNAVPELTGAQFDEIAELAQSTPQVGGQSLTFFRDKMVQARDKALETANAVLPETVDVDGFAAALKALTETSDAARAKSVAADRAAAAAERALREWQGTPEGALATLNEDIAAKGKKTITPENRAYYEPSPIFPIGLLSAMFKHVTEDDSYRAVRSALNAYDHGADGKDAFSDMAGWTKKGKELASAIAAANAAEAAASAEYATANAATEKLANIGADLRSDAQILEAVQEKVASYLSTPEFMKAAADKYGEDFPRNLSLLSAKLTTLEKLEEGTLAKMKDLTKVIGAVETQYQKLHKAREGAVVTADLEALRKQNESFRDGYSNYAAAAHESWSRATTFAPPAGTSFVDASVLQTLLLIDMMSQNRHYSADIAFVPAPTSGYTGGLMGVNKADAARYNLPTDAFTFDDARTGFSFDDDTDAFTRQLNKAFTFEPEPRPVQRPAPTPSFDFDDAVRPRPGTGFTFDDAPKRSENTGFSFDDDAPKQSSSDNGAFSFDDDKKPDTPKPSGGGGGFDF